VSFCIGLPYFVKIEQPLAELCRHIDFFKMAAGSHIRFDLDIYKNEIISVNVSKIRAVVFVVIVLKCFRWNLLIFKL